MVDRIRAQTASRPRCWRWRLALAGFAAVGAVGTRPAVWLSRDGQGWQSRSLALPAGARSAVLQRVAIQGSRITALGTQARPSGPVPFAAVSVNGGRTWRETLLPVPGRPAGVTALVAAGGGFLATGTLGDGGDQDVIVWWSHDGLDLARGPAGLAGGSAGRAPSRSRA